MVGDDGWSMVGYGWWVVCGGWCLVGGGWVLVGGGLWRGVGGEALAKICSMPAVCTSICLRGVLALCVSTSAIEVWFLA